MRVFQQCGLAFLASVIVLCGASAKGVVISADTFAHDDITGTSAVNGTTTDVGGQTWHISFADSKITASGDSFDAGSGSVYFDTGGGFGKDGNYVNFSAINSSSIFVQAEVKVIAGADGSGDFITLGLNASGAIGYDNPGPWVALTAAGLAKVVDGSVSSPSYRVATSTTGFTFNSGAYNLLELSYDFATQIATVSVNGTVAASLDYNIGIGNPAPTSIASAGFFGYNEPSSSARLDAFEVFVPEPTSLSLLACGGLVLIRRRRKGAFVR